MVEYRPIPDERREVFYEYTNYAFRPQEGPAEFDTDDNGPDLGSRRGLYEDDAPESADPLCVCRHHWFESGVRGDVHPTPGLSAVASPPEHRREGHVRQLLRESLAEYRDRGCRFSILWPFRYRFYRQYGWETSHRQTIYECEPDALAFAAEACDGFEFRRIEADHHERLLPAYDAYADGVNLLLERTEEWWRHRVFEGWETDPYVYAVEKNGSVRGYVVYRISGDWGDRTLNVSELVFVDREAYLALLSFCYNHDSQVSTVKIRTHEETTLLDVAPEPEEIDCKIETGPMVRIVDVAETLSALSYPSVEDSCDFDGEGVVDNRVTLEVTDPLVDWNDGRFRFEWSKAGVICRPLDTDARSSDLDGIVRTDVAALSALALGSRSASVLDRSGRLDGDPDAVALLDRAFPERPAFLPDAF